VVRARTRAARPGGGDQTRWRDVPVDRGDIGLRLDLVLLRHLGHEPGVSRARIQKWITAGRVTVNGAPAPRIAWRVAEGDTLTLDAREIRTRAKPRAEEMPLDVLFEDAHLIALNKPAGVVVHPSYKHTAGTLINALLWHAARWPSGDAPALLTRLDKLTSGVLLVAKRREVVVALQREMKAERIQKDYLAVVHGRPVPSRGTIDLALDRDPWDRRKVTVTDRGGQRAVTKYELLGVETGDGEQVVAGELETTTRDQHDAGPVVAAPYSLLRCRLVTGRMHQIRVHLAHKGWPLVGDAVYGRRDASPAFPRQALHAWRVSLTHPVTHEPLTVTAPVPPDLRALIDSLGLREPE
jgi:23S rRNA pseudouridine1911/1915/1917 synthase